MNWKPIPSAPGYEASDDGHIRSRRLGTPKPRKPQFDKQGYLRFRGYYADSTPWYYVHAAVAEAHLGPRPDGMQVRHLDGDSTNNRLENLAYGTVSENILDQVLHGTHVNASKTHCAKGHAYDEANTYRWNGHRHCRACNRDTAQRLKARKQVAS